MDHNPSLLLCPGPPHLCPGPLQLSPHTSAILLPDLVPRWQRHFLFSVCPLGGVQLLCPPPFLGIPRWLPPERVPCQETLLPCFVIWERPGPGKCSLPSQTFHSFPSRTSARAGRVCSGAGSSDLPRWSLAGPLQPGAWVRCRVCPARFCLIARIPRV